ncbi:MAG: RtcB family protein [Planctomycetota bacterium]
MSAYEIITAPGAAPIRAWIRGVPLEPQARAQVITTARMPCIHHHLAVMPDVHAGIGATIGTVIPTRGAIIPAAVGVDIGCGMVAARTSLHADALPPSRGQLRQAIEAAVPHGRSGRGGRGDRGAWSTLPERVQQLWREQLATDYAALCDCHPDLAHGNAANQLGTLGSGNHFIEVSVDEQSRVWLLLHSGSRGVGNRMGQYFIRRARDVCQRAGIDLPDRDLAYIAEDTPLFADYMQAVDWAQRYARLNRQLMLERTITALADAPGMPPFTVDPDPIDCHHNYVAREHHYGAACWVTRKGAVRAGAGEHGIIPGSMGARSYIVRGRGEPASFCSCSHGAGRAMSRSAARRTFNVADHAAATAGVECRKDASVLDETPRAYKDIDAVMAAQRDLVEPLHTLEQVVCVKG